MFAALLNRKSQRAGLTPSTPTATKIIKRDRVTYAPYSNDDYRL